MAKKVYDGEINKHTDWGGDESTENLPVSGKSVQEFIKNTLNGKMGVFHYDESNNRYIVFADNETRDSYIEDPTQTELILGTFDAPFNYNAAITLLSESYVAILTGDKNNVIKFKFDITNKQGASVVENVLCTYTFIKGSSKKVVKARYRYGQDVSFNIDNYLEDGTNNIIIAITGENTLAATSVSVTYQVVNLQLSDDVDISNTYSTGDIIYWDFSVKGVGTKTVEWWLEGVLLPKEESDEVIQTEVKRRKNISLASVGVGVHNIQLRAYTIINGEKFYSKTLYREIIIPERTTANKTYIATAFEFPAGQVYDSTEMGAVSDCLIYAKQYEDCSFRVAVHNTINSAQVPVVISLGNEFDSDSGNPYPSLGKELTTLMMQNNAEKVYSFVPEESGFTYLRLFWSEDSYNADDDPPVGNYWVFDYGVQVQESDVVLNEITENRELYLNAKGKSNDAKDKDSWRYNSYKAVFTGFEWNATSGWNDGALVIPNGASVAILEDAMMGEVPYAPLSGVTSDYLSRKGKTIELELGSKDVLNDDVVLLDMTTNGVGLKITASEAILTSSDGVKVSSKYKSGEFVRLSFVMNPSQKADNSGLALLYIDGIVSGAINFSQTDSFSSNAQLRISGSAEATAILRNIVIFNAALTKEEILNNRILYSRENKVTLINKNDIFDEETNEVSYEKLANQLPVMIITGDIQTLEAASNKKVKIVADIQYIDNQNPELSFTAKNATMTPQGTSSIGYPAKNFNTYFKDRQDTLVYDSAGKLIESKKLTVFPKGIPVDIFCIKADYAESSGTHNTGLARLWNDVLRNAKITKIDERYFDLNNPKYGKEYQNSVFMTSAQKIAATNGYPYDVRTTVDGRPICMFYRLTENSELKFMGKYNINNDKKNEVVFGFVGSNEDPEGIPGFDSSKMQCWEVLNNTNDLALFTDVSKFDSKWDEAYESRYPKDEPGAERLANLKALCTWINSTKDNVTKFKEEKWEHFDVYKLAAYYIYLMRHGAVDQPVKNAMLTSEDGTHYFFILYDNDTTHGLRNDSVLMYSPTIDRQTRDLTFVDIIYAYAGHDSVLWNNLEADDEFMEIVAQVDAALYAAGLSLKNVLDMLDNQQAGKWSETVYNYDAQYKYIRPYNDGNNKLFALQGSRKSHRDWWLSKRFSLYDAKWATGDYKNQNIEFKIVLPEGYEPNSLGFTIKSGYRMDYGYGVNEVVKAKNVTLDIDDTHRFTIDQRVQIGDPVRVYAANNIKELDIHELAQYLALLDIGKAYSESLGTKLEKLVVGTSDEVNTSLQGGISGLGKCTRLKHLDITNMQTITSLEELKHLVNLQELYAAGSGLKSVEFAEGAKLSYIELPEGLNSLKLVNVTTLTSKENLNIANWGNIRNLELINCGNLSKDMSIPLNWARLMEGNTSSMVDADKRQYYKDLTLTITNINWSNVNIDDLLTIGKAYKYGCKGNLTGVISLTNWASDVDETAILNYLNELKACFGDTIFNSASELYIKVPTGMFFIGPSVLNEGETGTYQLTVFGSEGGTVKYVLNGGTTSYITLDQSNGYVTVRESYSGSTSVSTYTFGLRAIYTPPTGAATYKDMTITVRRPLYPSVTINGTGKLGLNKEQTFTCVKAYSTSAPTDYPKATYSVNWSLTGDIANYASVIETTPNTCTVSVGSDMPETEVTGYLYCYIVRENGTNATSGGLTVFLVADNIIMTKNSNPEVLAIMYNAGLCVNQNYMTLEEAQKVTALDLKESDSVNSIFYDKYLNHGFEEFQYFTGVTELSDHVFYYIRLWNSNSTMKIILPETLTVAFNGDIDNLVPGVNLNAFYIDSSDSQRYNIVIPENVKYLVGNRSSKQCRFDGDFTFEFLTNTNFEGKDYGVLFAYSNDRFSYPYVNLVLHSPLCTNAYFLEDRNISLYLKRIYFDTIEQLFTSLKYVKLENAEVYINKELLSELNLTYEKLSEYGLDEAVTSSNINKIAGLKSVKKISIGTEGRTEIIDWGYALPLTVEEINLLQPIQGVRLTGNSQIEFDTDITKIVGGNFYCGVHLKNKNLDFSNFNGTYIELKFPSVENYTITNIKNSVTTLKLRNVSSGSTLNIPESITTIDILNCPINLGTIDIGDYNSIVVAGVRECTFTGTNTMNGNVYDTSDGTLKKDNKFLCYALPESNTDYTFTANMDIESNAFANSFIKNVDISTCRNVDYWAFYNSTLQSVTLGSSNIIYGSVFRNTLLQHVTIPSGATLYDGYVFQGCEKLETIVIKDNVTMRDNYSFYHLCEGCTSLKSFVCETTLNSMYPNSTFANCRNLEKIDITGYLYYVWEETFFNCVKLKTIYLRGITRAFSLSNYVETSNIGTEAEGEKIIYVPAGATGFDSGNWKTIMQDKFGFTISYTL